MNLELSLSSQGELVPDRSRSTSAMLTPGLAPALVVELHRDAAQWQQHCDVAPTLTDEVRKARGLRAVDGHAALRRCLVDMRRNRRRRANKVGDRERGLLWTGREDVADIDHGKIGAVIVPRK